MTGINHLLHDGAAQHPARQPASPDGWRAAALERRSVQIVNMAGAAGVEIRYLGIAPLFSAPTAYAGPRTDWLIAPVGSASHTVVPRAVRQQLLALDATGIRFPLVYVAHEVPKGELPLRAVGEAGSAAPVTVDQRTADAAVGPLPPAAATAAVAGQLGRASQTLLSILAKAAPIAAAVLAAPFVVTGMAASALVGLDPMVFGVIPAGSPVAGRPAAWYLLAQWDWE